MPVALDATVVGLPEPHRPRGYWGRVGRQLARNPVAAISAVALLLIVLAAVLAPWLGVPVPVATGPSTPA